jgi:Tol biopolymer transport system component
VLVAVLAAFGILAGAASAAFPGRNGLIAYTEYCCGGSDLSDYDTRLVAPDGSGAKLFRTGGDRVSFSPDGRRLLWGSAFGDGLFTMRADGRGRQRRLADNGGYDADWSPTGRSIIFVRYRESEVESREELWIRAGGVGRRLVAGSDPAWSVRGEIAFGNTTGGIDVIRPDGTGPRALVHRGADPDWSPDGRRVAYGASGRIWTVRADGNGRRRLPRGQSPAYSPDGHKIVYVGPGGSVRIMGAGGKRSHRLPFGDNLPSEDGDPLERPDWQPLRPSGRGAAR